MGFTMKKFLITAVAAMAIAACSGEKEEATIEKADIPNAGSSELKEVKPETKPAELEEQTVTNDAKLDAILAAQPDGAKARYQYRHPKETLLFFGIEPGMTVVDILPGNGWYTKILLPYLGQDGEVIGTDYDLEMWKLFTGFATEEFLEAKKTWSTTWTEQAEEWRADGDASVSAFAFGNMSEDFADKADAVIMVRAWHHLNRFEDEGGYRTKALEDLKKVLKPGGIVGIVQHRGPEGNDDVWAEGDQGYNKQSQVIALMEAAGFEFVDSSEINANPKDQPTNEDMVWRLPPSLGTSRDNPELRAQMEAIGETDRMTLKFRLPG